MFCKLLMFFGFCGGENHSCMDMFNGIALLYKLDGGDMVKRAERWLMMREVEEEGKFFRRKK